jgi:cell wall-associated NlpC family hydrolase
MVDYSALLGRQWSYGVCDCYTLIQDFYRLQGIELPEFERPSDLESCKSVFLREAPAAGFTEVGWDNRRFGDMLVMRMDTAAAMHGAIYVGDMRMLHQRMDSLSVVEPISRYYVKRIAAVFRYGADYPTDGRLS